ncbi:MAG: type II toxin-antitoxin system HicA family toxin [Bacteroides sp.]|nr:type II toxin-antitoxin system HicA family toxin [Bacteroides sp.]
MGRKEKLIERFGRLPKDFTYEETLTLLSYFGYVEHTKGATSGSRVRFKNEATGAYIDIHRPHPGSIMKAWMMKTIREHLSANGYIK